MTGIGERAHLLSPMINLSTHIRDVVNHIIYEDLEAITLVGFSYGGFAAVVSSDADSLGAVVRHAYREHPEDARQLFSHFINNRLPLRPLSTLISIGQSVLTFASG